VFILEKREIENFLLSVTAVERFIRLKQTLSANKQLPEPNEQAVLAAMNECAESLKQTVIDKRVARILCGSIHPQIDWTREPGPGIAERVSETLGQMRRYLEDSSTQSAAVIEEQTRLIDHNWDQRKFDFVPGDVLLDCVCQKFGVRFKKNNDGPRLASLMQKHEMDTQIRELITEMAKA
jgi:putative ATP-dependent endonuclease of OLD family